jgi:hypothetical protein
MSAQDSHLNNNGTPIMLGQNFTPEEATRLHNLREYFRAHADYLERMVDERRVEFVRWLIETGKINESL